MRVGGVRREGGGEGEWDGGSVWCVLGRSAGGRVELGDEERAVSGWRRLVAGVVVDGVPVDAVAVWAGLPGGRGVGGGLLCVVGEGCVEVSGGTVGRRRWGVRGDVGSW